MKRNVVIMAVCLFTVGIFSLAFAQQPVGEAKKEAAPPVAAEVKKDAPAAKEATPPPAPAVETKKEEGAKLTPGLYNCELTDLEFTEDEDGFGGTGNMKMQLDLKSDGTFTLEYYLTSKKAKLQDELFYKDRGKWKQEGETMAVSEQLEQAYKFDTGTMSSWNPPADGKTTEVFKIRNVTKDTFQEYDEKLKKWITWSKM